MEIIISLKSNEAEHFVETLSISEELKDVQIHFTESSKNNAGLSLTGTELIAILSTTDLIFRFFKFIRDWLIEVDKKKVKVKYGKNDNIEIEIESDMTDEQIKSILKKKLK